ncbi:MAG: hypothetical protein FJ271_05565 [Planctomycetes bacterium]|nr:hypothetical protein [Planctomycetota bacterium]
MAQDPKDARRLGLYMAMAQVGTEMVMPAVLGLLLDLYLDWTPWALIVGTILGLVGGLYHLIAIMKQLNKRDE